MTLFKNLIVALCTTILAANASLANPLSELPALGETANDVQEFAKYEEMRLKLEKVLIDQLIFAINAAEANAEWVSSLPLPEGMVLKDGTELVVVGGEMLATVAATLKGVQALNKEVFQKLLAAHPVLAELIKVNDKIGRQNRAMAVARTSSERAHVKAMLDQLQRQKASLHRVKPTALTRAARGTVKAVPLMAAGLAAGTAVLFTVEFNAATVAIFFIPKSERVEFVTELEEKSAKIGAILSLN